MVFPRVAEGPTHDPRTTTRRAAADVQGADALLELADYYLSRGQWRAAAGDDRAAAQLVGEFYRQLASDAPSKAHALKHAQESLISNRRYRHPFYWSPFLLIGNWF